MNRKLWTVLADRQPVAVVAAERPDEAWRIVAALDDHDDLPKMRRETDIALCSARVASRILKLAGSLGCAATFLACVKDGMFMTYVGGLSLETNVIPLFERAA